MESPDARAAHRAPHHGTRRSRAATPRRSSRRSSKESGQERVFTEIESPLLPVLAAMENEGIRLDPVALEEVGKKLRADIARLEHSIYAARRRARSTSARPSSSAKFSSANSRSMPRREENQDRPVRHRRSHAHRARAAASHRRGGAGASRGEQAALAPTSTRCPTSISPVDGRIHTTFYQLATTTGRLNSQDPNLQNIPIRTAQGREIRRAFVPREGDYTLLSADYSQIELRILAALTQDPGLLEGLTSGEDIHRATAAKVFGLPLAEVTKDQRNQAKMVNYGISYGISAFGLSQRLGIPRADAKNLIDGYFAQYPGIKQVHDRHGRAGPRARLRRDHHGPPPLPARPALRQRHRPRRRRAQRHQHADPGLVSADLIKIAMVQIARVAREENWRTKLLLQVHDELVFDLYLPEKERVLEVVQDRMKNALPELRKSPSSSRPASARTGSKRTDKGKGERVKGNKGGFTDAVLLTFTLFLLPFPHAVRAHLRPAPELRASGWDCSRGGSTFRIRSSSSSAACSSASSRSCPPS